jgi:hypothetical protein
MDVAVRRAATVRDDHFGPVALGVQIDGDLGWTTAAAWSWCPDRCRAAHG